jgi:hypothetical protein
MIAALRHLAQRELEPEEHTWLNQRFQVVAAGDLRSRTLLDLAKAQAERTAVIVTHAANYRDDAVSPYIAPGASTPLRPEDVWVPQLHALAAAAVEIARERTLYVAFDANQLTPRWEPLSRLLLSIDGCGVLGGSRDDDPDTIVAQRVKQWDEWLRGGRLGRVLDDIQQLPPRLDRNKALLRIQMMHRAGFVPQALQAIREEMASARHPDTAVRVKFAHIAQDANASRLASELLAGVADELDNREDLEGALATAHAASSAQIEDRIANRLAALFPGSPGLQQRRIRTLLAARDYAALATMATEMPAGEVDVEFYTTLARFLSGTGVPDYQAVIASAKDDATNAAAYRMACASDALARKLVVHALDLAMPIPTTPSHAAHGVKLLLQALEAILLLAGKAGAPPLPSERIQEVLLALIERLASNPANHALRVSLARLVQPAIAGTTGLALIASVVLQLGSRPIRLRNARSPAEAHADWLMEHKPFLESALDWLKAEEPIVIGRSVLPRELVTVSADNAVCAIADYLARAPLEAQGDADALLPFLALGMSLSPHCSDADYDLRLIRIAAGKLATAGYTQMARDLAEQAMLVSTATPRRRRLGWFAMADVYHRCHNHLEGLLALACALAADNTADEEQVWHETNAIARYFRDCGLHAHARSAIAKAKQLLKEMGLSAANDHRLDTLDLQIRQSSFPRTTSDHAELEALMTDVVRNAEEVLKAHDFTEPAAALLAQLLREAKDSGATIPPTADRVLAELLSHAHGSLGSLIATAAASTPSAQDLLTLFKVSSSARYSEDVGYDIRYAALAAGRFLASDQCIGNAVDTSLALELLADLAVAVPGWDEAPTPPPGPRRVDEPAEAARAISRDGISVVQAGFDAMGRLVRVTAFDGNLEAPIREPEQIITEERFRLWMTRYPYEYGINETTANLFYTTTADIRLSALPPGPVVLIGGTDFQPFPPNILYVDDEFAGRTRPIAAAPSLAWLEAARKNAAHGDGRTCAWISTAASANESQTLAMIAERLAPTFEQYGVTVDNGPTLPSPFAGASMTIIAAHGGVHPEGRYFQVVSDEGTLRVTAADLANALRNVGVVVLFVCSGGRADQHPGANTTLGLAKQILDRGAAAVIASPWPLDSRVPPYWLPVFMDHWSRGERFIQANFAANQAVDRQFSSDPARGLAMTLFGNPFLCRT